MSEMWESIYTSAGNNVSTLQLKLVHEIQAKVSGYLRTI